MRMKNFLALSLILAACAASAQYGIVGIQQFVIHKGTNVLTGAMFGSPDGSILAQPLKQQLFEYRIGDTFIWTLDGKKCVYRFDGEHWHDAEGKNADNVVLPSLKAEITIIREVDETSRISICGQLNAADQKMMDDAIRNRYPRPSIARPVRLQAKRPAPIANRPNIPPPGFITVEIKKGVTVIDPPFVDPSSIGQTLTTVKRQGWDVKKGDSITWRPGNYDVKCTFDGEKWNCSRNQTYPDLAIPLGKFPLKFERVVDEASTFNVHGWCDDKKAPK